MPDSANEPLKLFYCYAHEDKALRDQLDEHLSNMKRQRMLEVWCDRQIMPGTHWEYEIDKHLMSADIILLLVSSSFLNSDYCYGVEMQKALQQEQTGTARVIPILLRPADWEGAPFSGLQILPTGAKPVTRWTDKNAAYEDIAKELRKVVKRVRISLKTKEEWLNEGVRLNDLMLYQEALVAYDYAIEIDSNYAYAHNNKGKTLSDLRRYEEALVAYNYATGLDPNYAYAYNNKGVVLDDLKRYEEALIAYDRAIELDPNYAAAYSNKGITFNNLGRYEEALIAYDRAIELDPNYAEAYNSKGNALNSLKRYEEALIAFNDAIELNPNYTYAHNGKGNALNNLKRYEEALVAYDHTILLSPNYAVVYNNKGKTLQSLNRISEAQSAFQKARKLGFRG